MSFFSSILSIFKHVPDAGQVTAVEELAEAFKTFTEALEKNLPEIEGKEDVLAGAHDLSVHATELFASHIAPEKPIPQI